MKIKFATNSDIQAILDVQQAALQEISNEDMLVTLSEEEITQNVNDGVLCICRWMAELQHFVPCIYREKII